MADYPIVVVETDDELPLYGVHLKAESAKTVLITIHGTASNFYENEFMEDVSESAIEKGFSVLLANNHLVVTIIH